jgi:hypothetical protein
MRVLTATGFAVALVVAVLPTAPADQARRGAPAPSTTAAATPNAVSAPRGALRQLGGLDGCIGPRGNRAVAGCSAWGDSSQMRLLLSPSGRTAVLSSIVDTLFDDQVPRVIVLRREPGTGALHGALDAARCVEGGRAPASACLHVRGPDDVRAVDAGDRFEYLVGRGGLAVVAVDPRGRVSQAPGPGGCLRIDGGSGCGALRGLPPRGAELAMRPSPDGRNVYVSTDEAIAVLRRRADGSLEQLPGAAGCLNGDGRDGCGVTDLAGELVWVDGRNAYAATETAASDDVLVAFRRDRSSGALTRLPGRGGCLTGQATERRCTPLPGIGADFLSGGFVEWYLTPDGRSAYAWSPDAPVLIALRRDSAGRLAMLRGRAGCLAGRDVVAARGRCTPVRGMGMVSSVAVDPSGRVAHLAADALVTLTREPRTGALRPLGGAARCLGPLHPDAPSGCRRARGFQPAYGAHLLAVTRDGRSVFTTSLGRSRVGGSVLALRRRRAGGLRQLPGRGGCVSARTASCVRPRGFTAGPSELVLSPDDRNLYAVFHHGAPAASIAVFAVGR